MNSRPKTLTFYAAFLVILAITFPLQIMWLYEHTLLELSAIFAKLAIFNWAVIFAALTNAVLLYRASPRVKTTLPILAVLIAINNFLVSYGEDFSLTQTTVGTLAFMSTTLVLFQKQLIHLFQHPELRWWMRPPRKQMEVMTYINALNGPALKTKTFDLSEGGAFFPLDDIGEVKVGDRLMLSFSLGSLSRFRCEGKIVRKTSGAGQYPQGVGVQFEDLAFVDRQILKGYIHAGL